MDVSGRFELHAAGLQLQMIELNRTTGPDVYDKWVELEVHIKVPNFTGVIRWSALQKELLTLASDLERLNSEIGHDHTVHFTSTNRVSLSVCT